MLAGCVDAVVAAVLRAVWRPIGWDVALARSRPWSAGHATWSERARRMVAA